MLSIGHLERATKRPRNLDPADEAPSGPPRTGGGPAATSAAGSGSAAGGPGAGGSGPNADPAAAATSWQPLAPRLQPQPQSQQQFQHLHSQLQSQQGQQEPAKLQQPPSQPHSQQQVRSQTPLSQPQSQNLQALHEAELKPQLQAQQQLFRFPPLRVGGSPQLAGGAVSVLPTALPDWAQEAMRGVDPFWQPKETLAVITTQQSAPAPGTHGQLQSASALFTVSPSALEAIAEGRAQVRLVCVQPGDGPPRRCHWYGGSYVLLNHRPCEVTKEDRIQLLLGADQADQAVDLSGGLVRGANRLTLLWPVGAAGAVAALRLCEPRSAADLRCNLPSPLPLPKAVELVRTYVVGGEDGTAAVAEPPAPSTPHTVRPHSAPRTAGAGAAAANGDIDADGDGALGSGPVTVSLRCPLQGGLAAAPAHFGATAAANPLAFFDLGAFLESARCTGSWVCPATGRLGDLGDLRPHAFLAAVLRTLEHNGVRHRVEAIEVAPSGGWRPKDSRLPFMSVLDADPTDPEGRPPPAFNMQLLDPEDDGERDIVDLTDD